MKSLGDLKRVCDTVIRSDTTESSRTAGPIGEHFALERMVRSIQMGWMQGVVFP